jgi:hypothetical protein
MPIPAHALLMAAGGSGAPSEPPTVASEVACWWATDLVGVVADGDPVGSWTDRTSSVVVSATSTARPTFDVNGLSGQPVVVFDGSSDILKVASTLTTATTGCVVAVAYFDVFSALTHSIWGTGDEGSTTRFLTGRSGGPGDDNIVVQQNDNGTQDRFYMVPNLTTATPFILEWSSNGTAYSMLINNVGTGLNQESGSNTGDWFGDTSSRDNFTIGALQRSAIVNYHDGGIAFVKVADAPLSSGDRTALYGFLSSYYGIAI